MPNNSDCRHPEQQVIQINSTAHMQNFSFNDVIYKFIRIRLSLHVHGKRTRQVVSISTLDLN
jgi:hypothetical protein